MSNIMDQMNEEINKQKEDTNHIGSLGYALSDPLIGRIAALSQGFLPYQYLEEDTLSEKAVSPERGQLLLALVKSKLDSSTYSKIYAATNFRYAYLAGANLNNADLRDANLNNADLRDANLNNADFRDASLMAADLRGAFFRFPLGPSVDLSGAFLSGADLRGAFGLTTELLISVRNLYEAEGLPTDLKQRLEKEKPCLFEHPLESASCH